MYNNYINVFGEGEEFVLATLAIYFMRTSKIIQFYLWICNHFGLGASVILFLIVNFQENIHLRARKYF